ncbi:hypothetical protein CspHIS471_0307970 [Cutaneotrichosporon sp. HIS471]|nr:hypothetical protein CspHIS471_0307970 [Cutaneotrichosporon sp. HIS471]
MSGPPPPKASPPADDDEDDEGHMDVNFIQGFADVVGLENQKPDYAIAAVESRNTPMPTLRQLEDIFEGLPDEPKGPPRRVGPQYENRRPNKGPEKEAPGAWYYRFLPWLQTTPQDKPYTNPMAQMRNGDRAFIVAVNDSGNSGWIRFGRSGFEDFPMV